MPDKEKDSLCFTPNQTDDIFLAQILGHKRLGPNASLSGSVALPHRVRATQPYHRWQL
jgi:hypothetical protein